MRLIKRLDIFFSEKPFQAWFISTVLFSLASSGWYYFSGDIYWFLTGKIAIPPFFVLIFLFGPLLIISFIKFLRNRKKRVFNNPNTNFILKKQGTDDHVRDEILDLTKSSYTITVKPNTGTEYFRFGIKFSKTPSISNARNTTGNPLFHLTKELNNSTLFCTYYDENNASWPDGNRRVMNKYKGQDLILQIMLTNEGVSITISLHEGQLYHHHVKGDFKYGKILAWGDSHYFSLNVGVNSFPIQ